MVQLHAMALDPWQVPRAPSPFLHRLQTRKLAPPRERASHEARASAVLLQVRDKKTRASEPRMTAAQRVRLPRTERAPISREPSTSGAPELPGTAHRALGGRQLRRFAHRTAYDAELHGVT